MKTKMIVALVTVTAIFGAGGWWLAQPAGAHKHKLEKRTDAQGKTYYTCAMHPQVKQDEQGNCPICGMKLIKREEQPAGAMADVTSEMAMAGGEKKPLYYYDPMRPDQHFDAPGQSPFMDMQLVPKYASEGADSTVIEIDPRMAQNLGMRVAPVTSGTFWQRVEAVGSVALDERRIITVESRSAGWIEKLDVRAEGDPVRKGQRLAALYAPDLAAAQAELTLARNSGDSALISASQQRLRRLGGGQTLIAPASGFVVELMAREGAQLTPGMPLMKIADLSQVWLNVEIPEVQAGWVSEGKSAEARLKSLPGKVFEGTVDYLYPQLDMGTRTLKARLVFDNADGALRPGMFADVSLFGGPRRDVLLVPSEAVIHTGERTVVMVAEDLGRYRPAHVELGPERNGETVILSGLEAGQNVVVSGQFLIDSEASLRGAYQRLGADSQTSEQRLGADSQTSEQRTDAEGMRMDQSTDSEMTESSASREGMKSGKAMPDGAHDMHDMPMSGEKATEKPQ